MGGAAANLNPSLKSVTTLSQNGAIANRAVVCARRIVRPSASGPHLPLSERAFLTRLKRSPVEIVEPLHTLTMDATTALAIYRAEKDKALRERRVSHVQLMAEAQEAFRKMLADAQLARKGGRPKGSTNAAATPIVVTASQAAAAVTGKLVLKTTKTATPVKKPEKVTEVVSATTVKVAKPAKAEMPKLSAKPAKKIAKKPAPVKTKATAKVSGKRASSASVRKPVSKKATAPRKQAAARERSAKTRKR